MPKRRSKRKRSSWCPAHEPTQWRAVAECLLKSIRLHAIEWGGVEYGLLLAGKRLDLFSPLDAVVRLFTWTAERESCGERRHEYDAALFTLMSDAKASVAFETAFRRLVDEECQGR